MERLMKSLKHYLTLTTLVFTLLTSGVFKTQASEFSRLKIFTPGAHVVTLQGPENGKKPKPVFEYLATLDAPQSTQGNPPLQATSLQILENEKLALVTYHTRGEKIEGALDVVLFGPEQTLDRLEHFHFNDAEFNAVVSYFDESTQNYVVILGGNDGNGALVKILTFDPSFKSFKLIRDLHPKGFVTTGIALSQNFKKDRTLYGITGNPGVIFTLNLDSYQINVVDHVTYGSSIIPARKQVFALAQFKLFQAMSIGQVFDHVFIPMYALQKRGALAPARGVFHGSHIYTNTGGKLRIFRTENSPSQDHDLYLISQSRKKLAGTPNGIDAFKEHLVLAQGEAGAFYYSLAQDGEHARYLGKFDFRDDRGSSNDVRIQGNLVLVADGLGGVRLLKIKKPTRH